MTTSLSSSWSTVARAARSLRRSPGFVAIAAISLGTALGISTAVFAMIDTMTHPKSAFRSVDQLFEVTIRQHSRLGPGREEVERSVAALPGVERVATFRLGWVSIMAGDQVGRGSVLYTRPGLLDLLGARPTLGRLPTPAEDAQGQVAVVSDGLWRRQFGNAPEIGHATLTIGDRQFRVIGVFPGGAAVQRYGPEVWVADASSDTAAGIPVMRLRRGLADTTAVLAQLQAVVQRWTRAYTTSSREAPFSARLESMRPDPLTLNDSITNFRRAMAGAAICVLLIACANVAALMFARGMVRSRDYALRLALGASRGEIAREVVVEVAVLALLGCGMGSMLAVWMIGLITRALPMEMSWMGFLKPELNVRVLALSAIAVLASVAIAGGIPAWRASRTDPMGPLKQSAGGTTGRAHTRFRWLVIGELALAMTLVMGASLMIKSTSRMASYDFGYDARNLLTAQVGFWWSDSTPPATRERIMLESLERIRALPGVRSAALEYDCFAEFRMITSDLTTTGGENTHINGDCTGVGTDFFETIGMKLVAGRDFSAGDVPLGGAVILGARAARRLYPGQQAIGHMLKLGKLNSNQAWLRIVGIVRDQRLEFNPYPETGPDTTAAVYVLLEHPPFSKTARGTGFVIRPRDKMSATANPVARTLTAALPPRSIVTVGPWQSRFYMQLRAEQFLTLMFGLLGAASLTLGAAGLFSVISYIAGQRMREFAVRLALGATRENVLRLVMREALVMALGGTAIGAGLGMWAGFLIWDMMWGVYPVDAGALVMGEGTLLIVTMLACLVPALRATRANPVEILRSA